MYKITRNVKEYSRISKVHQDHKTKDKHTNIIVPMNTWSSKFKKKYSSHFLPKKTHLSINLTKYVQDVIYCRLQDVAERNFKKSQNKWRDVFYPWTEWLNCVVKMPTLPKWICKFSANPVKISVKVFVVEPSLL